MSRMAKLKAKKEGADGDIASQLSRLIACLCLRHHESGRVAGENCCKWGRFDRCTILSVSTEEEVQWLVRNGVFCTLQGALEDEEKVELKRYAESRGFYVKQI